MDTQVHSGSDDEGSYGLLPNFGALSPEHTKLIGTFLDHFGTKPALQENLAKTLNELGLLDLLHAMDDQNGDVEGKLTDIKEGLRDNIAIRLSEDDFSVVCQKLDELCNGTTNIIRFSTQSRASEALARSFARAA